MLPDIEVEGVTTFASMPKTSYRYVLKLKDDKLSIWMEDRASKKQWYKGGLAKDDYVTSANSISDASAVDYLRCFQDSLDGEVDESSDAQRMLETLKKGAVQLTFEVKIRILRSTRVTKYTFVLDPVSVERIDVLESKMRDQQEELERLRGDFSSRCSHITLETSTKNASTSNLLWSGIESDSFSVNTETGEVSIRRPGVYSVTAVVNVQTSASNKSIQVMKNGACVHLAYVSYDSGYWHAVTLCTSISFEANDLVTVTTVCNIQQSVLTIVQLG